MTILRTFEIPPLGDDQKTHDLLAGLYPDGYKVYEDDGKMACNCPSWKYSKGEKTCQHVQTYLKEKKAS